MKIEEQHQTTVAFRVPESVKKYYEAIAEKERRNLSQVLRIILEDHANGKCDRKKAA